MQTHHVTKTRTLLAVESLVALSQSFQSSRWCWLRSKRTAARPSCSSNQSTVSQTSSQSCKSDNTYNRIVLILVFLTPHREKIEVDSVQESRSTSSSTIFSTNLGRKGLGVTDLKTAWIPATYKTAWQKCLPGAHSLNSSN